MGITLKWDTNVHPKKACDHRWDRHDDRTEVRNFITIFKLFEMTDAYASIVPLRILL